MKRSLFALLNATLILAALVLTACIESETVYFPADPCRDELVPWNELDAFPQRVGGYTWGHLNIPDDRWISVGGTVVVNSNGTVCSVQITNSSGIEELDRGVEDVLWRSEYLPGEKQGVPVRSEASISLWWGVRDRRDDWW